MQVNEKCMKKENACNSMKCMKNVCMKKENACNSIAILTQIYQHHQSSKKLWNTTVYACFLYS